jgi:VWFA-related protein
MRQLAIVLLTVVSSGAVVLGQTPQAPVFRGGVTLVGVDVTVLDRDGNPVPGLTADDFEVKLDGHVQPVRAVAYENAADAGTPAAALAGGAATPPSPTREVTNAVRPPDPRLFVILLDDLSIAPSRGKGMFFAASRFVDGLLPSDVVGMTTSSGTFTVNPTRDHQAVDAAMRRTAGAFIDPRNRPINDGQQDSRTGLAIDAVVGLQEGLEIFWGNGSLLQEIIRRDCSGNGTLSQAQITESACAEAVERQARVVGEVARGQADQQLQTYLNVMNAMRPWPGVKSLVVISDGVAMAARDQRVRFEAVAKAAAAAGVELSVLVQEPDQVGVDDRSAIQAGVRRDDGQALMIGIQTIADLTGGNFYRVIGTPDPAFTRVAVASSAVYHLGVEAPSSTNPGRDFALAARVKRSGLTVHANRHAIAPAPVVTVPVDEQLRAGVAKGALSYGVPLTLATVLRRGASAAQLDLGANLEVPAGVTGPLTVMFGLVDAAGGLRTGRTTVAAPAEGGNYRLSLSLPVAPGVYRLRFAVADATGRVGSLGTGVTAALGRVGPLLTSDVLTSWSGADGKPQFLALEEVPTTAASLRTFLELYAAPDAPAPTDVRVQWSVIGSAVQPVAEQSVVPVRTADRWTAAGQFALDTLPLGSYEIRATVFVNGTAAGVVSTTIRKTEKNGGVVFLAASPPATDVGSAPGGAAPFGVTRLDEF